MQIERFKSDIIPLRDTLFRTAVKYLQHSEDAEDVVQETLLRMWHIREQLDTVVNPAAFAMQTTKNICFDRLKLLKEKTEADEFHLGATTETPHSTLEKQDAVALVKKIIEHLPELQKLIIQMRDVEGYELQEIADITGTQVSAVTVNLSRARKKVREHYILMMNYKTGDCGSHPQ
ncbi:MAG: sigma-70 family RNA polymerase sigma factor [Candidatus Symbiothrix sp.]|jgi:RNA polymerase sigma-70 factor (ECF subfamily)|nr:sigma-70 family RNA polymerase sigma factor [Candidatus Symbiothrix sp.]